MATLSEAAIFARKTVRRLAIAAAGLITLLAVIALTGTVKNSLFPPKPPAATVAFGKIPKLDLSEGIRAQGVSDYKVETITGELPTLALQAKVFKVLSGELSFGDLERAKQVLAKIGFTQDGQSLESNLYKFTDPKSPSRNITIDITNYNFELTGNYLQDAKVIGGRAGSRDQSIEVAANFMDNFELDRNLFPKDKAETRLLKIDGDKLTVAPSAQNANLVEVNFKRADIDKLPIVRARESSPAAQALVAQDRIVSAYASKLNIAFHQFATYPLKGVARAADEVAAGKGFFNKEPEGSVFAIRDVTLAYMETKKSEGFLQPVYVFKSDKGQEAYVAAIDESWTK